MPTDLDPNSLTLAIALTAAGAAIIAGFVTGVVEILKSLFKALAGHEQQLAFFLSGIVVLAAEASAVQTGAITLSIATIFTGILAWYGIARIAMGIHDDVTRAPNSLTGPPA